MGLSGGDSFGEAGNVLNGDKQGLATNVNSSTTSASLAGAQSSGATLATIDTLGYQSLTLQGTSFGAGVTTLVVQQSNDNATWVNASLNSLISGNATLGSTIAAAGFYTLIPGARYIKITLGQAQTSGTSTVYWCAKAVASGVTGLPAVLQSSAGTSIGNVVISAGNNQLGFLFSGSNAIGGLTANQSGGCSLYSNLALTNTAVAVKASAANCYGYSFYNPSAAVTYVQFFNLAVGSVTLGTTTPTAVVAVAPSATLDVPLTVPEGFGTALTIAATTTASGSTAPATALVAKVRYA